MLDNTFKITFDFLLPNFASYVNMKHDTIPFTDRNGYFENCRTEVSIFVINAFRISSSVVLQEYGAILFAFYLVWRLSTLALLLEMEMLKDFSLISAQIR